MSSLRRLKLFCLAAALVLAGCATTGGDPSGKLAESGTARAAPPQSPKETPATTAEIVQPLAAAEAASQAVARLQPPADLWERIRRGFAMPNLDTELVRDREQWYTARPDYMLRMTERSRKYLFYIVEELERRNMPTEIALLPFIESAFNPQAVSSAKAAGMWQFMPATGTYFDLKQNAFRDDRRAVLDSTRAALDYLQKLYGMFGDWELALAAYNWGEGSVSKALARNKAAGLGLSYSELNMPNETRYYVPKLQAVKNIIAAPDRFRSRLSDIGNHPFFDTVPITRDIDVALAAQLAEVSVEDFKALNPSIHRPVIMAAGTPQILLPWDNAAIFERNLATYNGARLANWTAWVAPSTMKAGDAARRVGMTEEEFRSVNNIPPNMLVKVGSSVLVKRSGQLDADVAPNVADNGQLALAPDVVLKRAVVQARKGDTAALLSKRYGVSAANLAEWNPGLGSATLPKGQSVVVFVPVRAKAATAQRAQAPAAAPRAAAGAKSVPRSSAKPAAKPASKPPARPAAKAKR